MAEDDLQLTEHVAPSQPVTLPIPKRLHRPPVVFSPSHYGNPAAKRVRNKEFALNKGMLDPIDISGTLVFLLSDYSTFVNGQNIIVDDGWTL